MTDSLPQDETTPIRRSDASLAPDEIYDAFLSKLWCDYDEGSLGSLDGYVAAFPGIAERIAEEYLALKESVSRDDGERWVSHYRLIRELGRGGQAVVWEAEDEQLHRRVALKLISGLGSDAPQVLQRFRREAEITSRLDHPGICPVLEVGFDDAPWIAMRLIKGVTLAERVVSARLRVDEGSTSQSFLIVGDESTTGAVEELEPPNASGPSTSRELMGTVALIEKVARALHAAHEAGVIHRDIKPGNIMVAGDAPVILDFGLARDDDGASPTLTQSGDLMGTPPYMSPEQLTRQSIRVDRRSDVYSLGVTLFECLTLRRPFERPTRQALYGAILTEPHPNIRGLNAAIPRDLKVVIDTALAKNRDDRYQTALELADELHRVRTYEPIAARPAGPLLRLRRWSQRKPATAALVGVLLVALPLISILTTRHFAMLPQVRKQQAAELKDSVERLLSKGLVETLDGGGQTEMEDFEEALRLNPRCAEAVAMLSLFMVRQSPADALEFLRTHREVEREYPALTRIRVFVLRRLGRAEEAGTLSGSVQQPKSHVDWYVKGLVETSRGDGGDPDGHEHALRSFVTAALSSPYSRKFYHFIVASTLSRLENRADRDTVDRTTQILTNNWPNDPLAWFCAGRANMHTNLPEAVRCLQEAVRLDSDSVRAHYNLGMALSDQLEFKDAISSFENVIALEPTHWEARNSIGTALERQGKEEAAIASYRKAIEFHPEYAEAHNNLGLALKDLGQLEMAHEHLVLATKFAPGQAGVHHGLGVVLEAQGNLEEAIEMYKKAVGFDPSFAKAHYNIGVIRGRQRKLDEAIESYRRAITADPEMALAHNNLGLALSGQERFTEAMASYREAIRVDPALAIAHNNLGQALKREGKVQEAMVSYQRAIKHDPNLAEAHTNLGGALADQGQLEKASEHMRLAVRLMPKSAATHYNLGVVLRREGRLKEAVEHFSAAVELQPDLLVAKVNLVRALFAWVSQLEDDDEIEKAIGGLEAAAKILPENIRIRRKIDQLRDEL